MPGLRTFLSQAVIPDLMGTIVNKCITLNSLTHSLPGDNHCDKLKYKINSESGGQRGLVIKASVNGTSAVPLTDDYIPILGCPWIEDNEVTT